ncbi:SoxR reducing system RseC family protein [Clostridium chromiireducens]|uniref:Siderophore-interacting protein n=1 Tax=Clostridium chromiireducens TaxID=225345 RepID=A0A1V4IFI5_9CLOT|nr:SoxR reducing system RseC family protein [Clostridium chromiireducens]MVX64434.1 siderophore-interacting protein [Clostridium chromiireducens]OPJ58604.1 SoxR reducing system protein RseC [Clostridium chromiireducens]RII35649.1 siderophore-interacting protein [Clostridium chromiireducens]
MKTEQGLVVEVIDNVAKVRVGRHSDCKNCGACPGSESIIITASNKIGAKPGQRVIFEVKETNMLWAAFIVFILPLIALFVGAMIGGGLGKYLGVSISICQLIGGIAAALLAVLLVKKLDRDTEEKGKSKPQIIQILK